MHLAGKQNETTYIFMSEIVLGAWGGCVTKPAKLRICVSFGSKKFGPKILLSIFLLNWSILSNIHFWEHNDFFWPPNKNLKAVVQSFLKIYDVSGFTDALWRSTDTDTVETSVTDWLSDLMTGVGARGANAYQKSCNGVAYRAFVRVLAKTKLPFPEQAQNNVQDKNPKFKSNNN